MMYVLKTLLISLILNVVFHEGGHWLPAWKFGLNPRIKFSRSWSPVRVQWDPTDDRGNRIIATMGFGLQMIAGYFLLVLLFFAKPSFLVDFPFVLVYWAVLIVHFCLYPFRNKDSAANDFSKMDSDENPDS